MNLTCKKNLNLVNFYVMNIGLGFTISYLWYNKKRDIAFAIVALFLTLGHLRDTLCAIFQTIYMLYKSRLANTPYSSTLTKTIVSVVPCYNEEEVLSETSSVLRSKLSSLIENSYINKQSKILFVDDGSSDSTWSLITKLNQSDRIKYKDEIN